MKRRRKSRCGDYWTLKEYHRRSKIRVVYVSSSESEEDIRPSTEKQKVELIRNSEEPQAAATRSSSTQTTITLTVTKASTKDVFVVV